MAWALLRYQKAAKRIERMDTFVAEDGIVVMCRGSLYGIWSDGKSFDNIRFAYWFLVRDGKILHQEVWNDIAETLRR